MFRVEYLMHGLRLLVAVMSLGCATYRGTATSAEPAALARQGGWYMVASFPLVRQEKSNDCGAAALASVLPGPVCLARAPASPPPTEAALMVG